MAHSGQDGNRPMNRKKQLQVAAVTNWVWICLTFNLSLRRPFSFPMRNVPTICHVSRYPIGTRKVTFRVPMIRAGLWMAYNGTTLPVVTRIPAVSNSNLYPNPNPNLNHNLNLIRWCFPKWLMIWKSLITENVLLSTHCQPQVARREAICLPKIPVWFGVTAVRLRQFGDFSNFSFRSVRFCLDSEGKALTWRFTIFTSLSPQTDCM